MLVLAALAVAFILTRPETATMPGLTGETFNAAQLATARAGFTQTPVQQTRPARRRSEIGAVVQQEPAPGTEAKRDAKIVLVVGVGRERTSVPNLKGMDLDQAQTALRKAKLKLGPATGDALKGTVARQSPQPGERARVGTGVTVWLAAPDKEVDSATAGRDRRAGDATVPRRPPHAGDRRQQGHLGRSARDRRHRPAQRRGR